MIQLQIGITNLHGIWNSLQVEKKPTKHSLTDFLRVSLMPLFQFSLKCNKNIIIFGIRRFVRVYLILLGIHINIVKKCYQLALH
jgi:hypothetical protein